MKRLGVMLVLLAWTPVWSVTTPLTSVGAVRSLTNAEARQRLDVNFEATVTYYDNLGRDLFVQDGDQAVYVFAKPGGNFVPGDRVRVRGTTDSDFKPDVNADEVTLLGHGAPPQGVPANFAQLIRVELDCVRVTMRGRVRSADIVKDLKETNIYLNLLVDGGYVDALVLDHDPNRLKGLLDAEVEITGAAAGKFDSKMQLAGIMLQVQSLDDVKIVERAVAGPESLPVAAMDQILDGYAVQDETRRVRVRGSLTYYQPGQAVVLQEGNKSLWISTQYEGPLHIGQVEDVTGFPDAHGGLATLTQSEVTETGRRALVAPVVADWTSLASGKHAFELVSVEGKVTAAARAATKDEYLLESDGRLFSAIYRHPDVDPSTLPAMKKVQVGARVRVTGICAVEVGSDPLGRAVAFNVLLRGFDDVEVVAAPSWLSIRHLVELVGVLLVIVMGVSARGWILERRLARQTAALAKQVEAGADMERRRSRILEDINARRDLAEILEHIFGLVSFKLNEGPCWCVLANGVRLGDGGPRADRSMVVRLEIPARSGPAHGEIFAGVEPDVAGLTETQDTLAMGVRLAALAIETSGLYSDLLRRSEFDLLTDVHNRFSLEKGLNAGIEHATHHAQLLGLIYIDLDDFKQVNDRYGHHVGDLFLQEAARRMKHQLRPGDMLARVGGDEFGVVVPLIPCREGLKEIAGRLERSFDEPVRIDGYTLQAAASIGIAVFPDDGTTVDDLLSAADAAMYLSKNTKAMVGDAPK